MRRIVLATLLSGSALQAEVPADHATRMAESRELFVAEVRPLLLEHCVQCHGGEKTKSGLDLTTREGLLQGGDQDVGVVVGNSAESLLYQAVAHLEEELAMPPKKPKLPVEAIAAIGKWIDLGAAYDKPLVEQTEDPPGPMQVTEGDRSYWAYAPLRETAPPPVANGDWSHHAIDRFVSARHESEGLQPAELVAKRALIRRAYFDLLGLPPSPAEIDAFLDDTSPGAYERLLDDLLARPAYGERWARHWLDVARFAESHGFEHDYDRKFAYHYRDFVIRALNADMPYDQFVRWQIAGDEIAPDDPEAMMATGFLGAGVYPTQITISEAERIRYDALDDMLSTIGSAMLATTVGCARCHDHKYDPIPMSDYYELLSAFSTTVRSEIDLETSQPEPAELAAFEEELAAVEARMNRYRQEEAPGKLAAWLAEHQGKNPEPPASPWIILQPESLTSAGGATFTPQPDGSHLAGGTNPDFDVYTFVARAPDDPIRALRIEALAHDSLVRGGPGRAGNGNIALTDLTATIGSSPLTLTNPRATFNQGPSLHVAGTIDADRKSAWAVDPQFGKDHAAVYAVEAPENADGELRITLRFENNQRHNIGRLRVSVSSRPADGLPLLDGGEDPRAETTRQLLATPAQGNQADPERRMELYLALDDSWATLMAERSAVLARKPGARTEKVMVCSEGFKPMRHHTSSGSIPDFYPESYHLERGDPDQKRGKAELGFLQVLMRAGSTPETWKAPPAAGARTSQRRLGLANWITDHEQGAGHLLARVIVNRLWHHHFGRGLVETTNDFGFQGSRPTHPELLDYLASDLIANGWKLKPLHKQIMLSRTYRLGRAESHPENERLDPENRLWWKRDPRRLEAEAIRDNALAVSGLLDRTLYGPGTLDQGMKRRSIYFFVKRSKLVPVMQLFDWPDTMTSLGRRAVTTTPSQALVFLNSPEVREMAVHFAQSLAGDPDPLGTAAVRATGAPPTDQERAVMTRFLDTQAASHSGNRDAALVDLCQALLASNATIYVE